MPTTVGRTEPAQGIGSIGTLPPAGHTDAFTLTENNVLGQRVLELFFSVSLKCVSLGWLR